MPVKVKRGLGLLVVAAIAFVLTVATQGQGHVVTATLALLFGIAMIGCAAVGLVLIAWGLLRD